MVFSSTVFIFFFLPLVLAGYFLIPGIRGKNAWLLFMSMFFYFWGGHEFIIVIICSIVINYIGGYFIGYLKTAEKRSLCKLFLVLAVFLNLLNLGYWKYIKFFMQVVNDVTGWHLAIPDIVLPIGISFFTFQGMSYVIDVYRGDAQVQKNIFRMGLYISLFPQLIAGPIVRYTDIEQQLNHRTVDVDDFAEGIFKWGFTLFLWLISMIFFRTATLQESVQYFRSVFGLIPTESVGFSLAYYIHKYEIFIIVLGFIVMMPIGKKCYEWLKKKVPEGCFSLLENAVTILLFGVSILYVVTGTYNPFIYFQF